MTDGLVSEQQDGRDKGLASTGGSESGSELQQLAQPARDGVPDAGRPTSESGKDSLLDLIRITAIGRVVLWHTWAWAWLTWIPAMPAMFFVTGALLEGSVARRGWLATLKPRLQRLLVPYWVYAGFCWVVMLIDGWSPTLQDGAKWVLPLLDPVGSDDLPGLWVPLWYLRAYLWFLLAAGVLAAVWRRLGVWSVLLSAGVAAGMGYAVWEGHLEVSQAVGDGVAYLPFVLAGMGYWATRRLPDRKVLLVIGLAAAAAAVVSWQQLGLENGVVNSSYLQTLLVGTAGVALVFGMRDRIVTTTDRWSGWIRRLNSRALTIYLWHGFGLIAAQRLVDLRMDPGPLRAVAALAVVLAVVAAAVVVFGPIEDLAAGRRSLADLRRSLGHLTRRIIVPVRGSAAVLPGATLVVVALAVGVPAGVQVEGPLSGQAVVTRGQLIDDQLNRGGDSRVDVSGMSPNEVLGQWVEENHPMLDGIGATWIDGAVALPSGELVEFEWYGENAELPDSDTIAWWSMTKAVTSAWLLSLVDDGVVELDDPLSDYVDHTPRAQDMTLRQLASHTSGVPPELDDSLLDANPAEEIDTFVQEGELAFEPGTGYGYSRVGYYLLALALERASGQTWGEAVNEMADQAGVEIELDDWLVMDGEATDPDGHGYRGGLWSAGGLISRLPDGAGLLHWMFTDGLSDAAIASMTEFPADQGRSYYGLGLVPLCPCQEDGDVVHAERVGLDTASGSFAVDLESGAAVLLRPHEWWSEDGPVPEFYDLQQRLLDSVTE